MCALLTASRRASRDLSLSLLYIKCFCLKKCVLFVAYTLQNQTQSNENHATGEYIGVDCRYAASKGASDKKKERLDWADVDEQIFSVCLFVCLLDRCRQCVHYTAVRCTFAKTLTCARDFMTFKPTGVQPDF